MEIYFKIKDNNMEILTIPPITYMDGKPFDIDCIIVELQYNKQYDYFYNMKTSLDFIFKYKYSDFCEYCLTDSNDNEWGRTEYRIFLFRKKEQHDFIMSTLPNGISYKCLYYDNRYINHNMKIFYIHNDNIYEICINENLIGELRHIKCINEFSTLYYIQIFGTQCKRFCIVDCITHKMFIQTEMVTDSSEVIFRYDEPMVKLALYDQ